MIFRNESLRRRAKNAAGKVHRGDGGGTGIRQTYKAVCGECGEACNIPFKPREGRPVYCKDCFLKHRNRETTR